MFATTLTLLSNDDSADISSYYIKGPYLFIKAIECIKAMYLFIYTTFELTFYDIENEVNKFIRYKLIYVGFSTTSTTISLINIVLNITTY